MKFVDLTGKKFGRLTVIKRDGSKNHQAVWLCLCDCGKITKSTSYEITHGLKKSCGCYRIERVSLSKRKHGMTGKRLFRIWLGMRKRVLYKKNPNYKRYGGRGIKICKEWSEKFEPFMNWSENNGYNDSLTLDRIDVDGDYCPENCRWVKEKEQQRNRRNNIVIEYMGLSKCLSEWAEILGVSYGAIYARIKRGYSFEEAFNHPKYKHKKKIDI